MPGEMKENERMEAWSYSLHRRAEYWQGQPQNSTYHLHSSKMLQKQNIPRQILEEIVSKLFQNHSCTYIIDGHLTAPRPYDMVPLSNSFLHRFTCGEFMQKEGMHDQGVMRFFSYMVKTHAYYTNILPDGVISSCVKGNQCYQQIWCSGLTEKATGVTNCSKHSWDPSIF